MIDRWLAGIAQGAARPVYLVHGDLVLAEPVARRLAEALAQAGGCAVEARRHPPRLGTILDDLRTFSLFGNAKVALVVDSAVLADPSRAADLIDDAEDALPVGEGELPSRARPAASRLLQALRLFGIDPFTREPQATIAALPGWALEGGRAIRQRKPRGRTKKEVEALTEGLVELLVAARAAELEGSPEGDLAELGAAIEKGFPPWHHLVLVERTAAPEHPLVRILTAQEAALFAGEVEAERGGGFSGLDGIVQTLQAETGVGIARDALAELARRTLRQEGGRGAVEADSTARLAAEYRKLANLARTGAARELIDRRMVEEAVEDRGQEDVWKLLDAVGAGRAGEAIDRYRRYLASADDPLAARLSLFALLAALCRQMVAIRGLMTEARLPAGERNPKRFEERFYPALTGELPNGRKSPLKGLNSFRLFKAYGSACRFREGDVARLPWLVLETELRLKGSSSDPDAAFVHLLTRLASASV